MPAYPRDIPVNVEDGIVYIRLFGDEYNKRAENSEGYTIIQHNGIWYYAENDIECGLKASPYKLTVQMDDETQKFLENIPKHLVSKNKSAQSKSPVLRNQAQYSHIVKGSRRILVILMQYKDLPMTKSQGDFDDLFNSVGYSEDGARGSVRDFFADASYEQLQLKCDIIGPFTSKYNRAYYGGNDRNGNDNNPEELFEEAIKHATEYVSLKDYDTNQDGVVDNIHIIFAGHGEEAGASSDAIWSHEATFFETYDIQGMKIDRYSCAPELRGNTGKGISRIGPHCHEIGHALGAMDYYDTDYENNGYYLGTGNWDVMASGSWNNDGVSPADFNPYVKAVDFGWISPTQLPSGQVSIPPSCDSPDNYYVFKSSDATDYYLLENRTRKKWGYGVPGEGLLVFHVHPEISSSDNNINSKSPQKCYVVCASSRTKYPNNTPSSYGDIDTNGCPYPGKTNNMDFGQNSTPAAFFWDAEDCGIELNNILIDEYGCIHLENNSLGLEDGNIERVKLYFEGFEEDVADITIIENGNLPSWIVESDPVSPSKYTTKPPAYKGRRSLQLSAKRIPEKVSNEFSFSINEPAESDNSILKLKLHVYSMNSQPENPNVIQICYRLKDSVEWQQAVAESSEDNHWQQYSFDLPYNIFPEIHVEGTAFTGSILAIDDLEVEQYTNKEYVGISQTTMAENVYNAVYSIYGTRLQQPRQGLNVIRDTNGNVYKLFLK